MYIINENQAMIMEFLEDWDIHVKDNNIYDPFKTRYELMNKRFQKNANGRGITVCDLSEEDKALEPTNEMVDDFIRMRNRYIAQRIFNEIGYDYLSTTNYVQDFIEEELCLGKSGQCSFYCNNWGKCKMLWDFIVRYL